MARPAAGEDRQRLSLRDVLSYEVALIRRVVRREVSHPGAAATAAIISPLAGAGLAIWLTHAPFTLEGIVANALPVAGGSVAGFLAFLVGILSREPALHAKEQATRIAVLEGREKDKPEPRIEASLRQEAVRFEVWNDGSTGTFRARHQILEAHPPLDHPVQMESKPVHWLHPSAPGTDSCIFSGDFDEFEVSLTLRASAGLPASFFATQFDTYDPIADQLIKGPPVTPEVPPNDRWLDIGIVITTDPPIPAHWRVYRVRSDRVEIGG